MAQSLLVVAAAVACGIAGAAATAPQFQPLHSAQFQPLQSTQFQPLQSAQYAAAADGRSYAAAYGHAVHQAPPAAVQVGYVPTAVYKPDLSAYAAASFPLVEQLRRFDPVVRPVQTVVPRVTAVEPSVSVFKTYVDVPVPVPAAAAAAYPYEYRPQLQLADPSPYYYRHDYNSNHLLVDRK